MRTNIFELINRHDMEFQHVKTPGEARAIAYDFAELSKQIETALAMFTPAQMAKHLQYTSDCWADIADEMERQGR